MIDFNKIRADLSGAVAVLNVEEVKPDLCRVKTGATYPDQSHVDVFVVERDGDLVVTDLGNTQTFVGHYGLSIIDESSLARAAKATVGRVGLSIHADEIAGRVEDLHGISVACCLVASACYSMAKVAMMLEISR